LSIFAAYELTTCGGNTKLHRDRDSATAICDEGNDPVPKLRILAAYELATCGGSHKPHQYSATSNAICDEGRGPTPRLWTIATYELATCGGSTKPQRDNEEKTISKAKDGADIEPHQSKRGGGDCGRSAPKRRNRREEQHRHIDPPKENKEAKWKARQDLRDSRRREERNTPKERSREEKHR
jgi:hypothetical protein